MRGFRRSEAWSDPRMSAASEIEGGELTYASINRDHKSDLSVPERAGQRQTPDLSTTDSRILQPRLVNRESTNTYSTRGSSERNENGIRELKTTLDRLEEELELERQRSSEGMREMEELRARLQRQEEELTDLEKKRAVLVEEAERQKAQKRPDPRVKLLFDNEQTLNRQRYGAPLL